MQVLRRRRATRTAGGRAAARRRLLQPARAARGGTASRTRCSIAASTAGSSTSARATSRRCRSTPPPGRRPQQEYSEALLPRLPRLRRRAPRPAISSTMVRALGRVVRVRRPLLRAARARAGRVGRRQPARLGRPRRRARRRCSARRSAGYVVVGSRHRRLPRRRRQEPRSARDPVRLADDFARWTAIGALSPFMQLHGRANLDAVDGARSRRRDGRALSLLGEAAPRARAVLLQPRRGGVRGRARRSCEPVGDAGAWAGDYRYTLGDAFLVAPILDDTGVRDVALPAGARWYDWWASDTTPLDGGTTLAAYDATDRSAHAAVRARRRDLAHALVGAACGRARRRRRSSCTTRTA